MIRAVIFDCFGVLYLDPELGFYEREVKNFHQIRQSILDVDKQSDYGFINQEEHDRAISDLTGLSYEFVHANVMGEHVRNEALLSFSQLIRDDYKVGMLSNVNRSSLDSFFSDYEQNAYFDAVVISSDVGVIKPNREIFLITAERLGVRPEECIMIDDRSANLDGAYSAGMQTVLYESTEQCIRDTREIITREAHA